jgi:hypothetical protein
MAKAKTGSFWLTAIVRTDTVPTAVQETIDLGAYVDVGDQQAIAIEYVDFIVQVYDTVTNSYVNSFVGSVAPADAFQVDFQLSDLNPGTTIISADNNALISSGVLLYDEATNNQSQGSDFYPDDFAKGGKLSEARMVIQDNLFLVAVLGGNLTLAAGHTVQTTVRIKAKIVSLGIADWMGLSISGRSQDA